ncbi:MAG: sigma-70 family RNA polymerase sigma factor [Gemmatimonadetes bacterium]|jgi:RNA polymerase sigma-70 factor (ECF subfamily)|nr:sigma-70 family RNA polymerase sigma factor [Gemmatimonadota bacterium]MBK9549748.1 sigma-70 family RNA polymerase sigma factor [Gemmatimonadota bacterium]
MTAIAFPSLTLPVADATTRERPTMVASPASDAANLENSRLVAAHLAGDERAFGELVRRYQVRLLNFIFRMIGDRERAEDLVQEAFVRVHRHLHRFDQSRKFSTWLYTIGSNLAKNELRNRARSPLVFHESSRAPGEHEGRTLEFEDSRSRPDDLFANRHLRELVEATVARLSPHHRIVFVLRELEGKSYEDIAEVTNTNLGTVKSRLNRARTSFQQMIAPFLD